MSVDGVASNWRKVINGTLQRTLLGPIRFVIFIIDMPEEVKYNCKLYNRVGTSENKLQLDLSNLEK